MKKLLEKRKTMDVIALVGPSGTGKSHRALFVAHKHAANAIIDDGILIKDGKIIAGKSAKKEQNRIMAVRRAIFILPGHAEEVRTAIEKTKPHRILILGTSEHMVHKIAKALKLPSIKEIIHIEDIATKAEIAKAQFHRLKEGKHIIPVPTIELRPHFSGYLIDPLQSFFKHSSRKRRRLGEKSIVRPIFSYYGKLDIDDKAVGDIIRFEMIKNDAIKKASHIRVDHVFKNGEERGIRIKVDVTLCYSGSIPSLLRKEQEKVRTTVEFMTGMTVKEVDIHVRKLVMPK